MGSGFEFLGILTWSAGRSDGARVVPKDRFSSGVTRR